MGNNPGGGSMEGVFDAMRGSPSASPLVLLSDELSYSTLVLSLFLDGPGKWDGPALHRWIAQWIDSDLEDEEDLWSWLLEEFPGVRKNGEWPGGAGEGRRKRFEWARKQARRLQRQGVRALTRTGVLPSSDGGPVCPGVLYGVGAFEGQDRPRVAVFNSRKTKLVSPRVPWLTAFRGVLGRLERLCPGEFGYVGSRGTMTYDLLTAHARRIGSPLIQVLPIPIVRVLESLAPGMGFGEEATAAACRSLSRPRSPELLLSCMAGAGGCSGKRSMICRDRLVAFLSDFHVVLEVRTGGNLENVLIGQQTHCPRPQWIFHPLEQTGQAAANIRLLREFPSWAYPFYEEDLPADAPECFSSPGSGYGESALHGPGITVLEAEEVAWGDYLYHYTRACPGPWPGQSGEEFMLSLLQGHDLAGHTALDTLIRIVLEERIRASRKLVRGERAVVSWTSRHPMELNSIRRWNRALMRWTFEPFGVAVKRSSLLKVGAKPVIYAAESVYSRLDPSQRYRFQLHSPPGCSWKMEREWRLPQDLHLDCPPVHPEWFLFVPGSGDARRLARHLGGSDDGARLSIPVVVLPRTSHRRDNL